MPELTDLLNRALDEAPATSITRDTAITAGRRARRRRTSLIGVLGALLAVAAVAAAAPSLVGRTPIAAPSAEPTIYPLPQLPVAAGVPGAAERPDLVGTDPLLIHFTIQGSTWPTGSLYYETGDRWEQVNAGSLQVKLSPDRDTAEKALNLKASEVGPGPSASPVPEAFTRTDTVVNGRPAVLVKGAFPSGRFPHYGLLWQPVDGLWVAMMLSTEHGEPELWRTLATLHLDVAGRCVMPFQLTDVPAGMRVTSCRAGIPNGDPVAAAEVILEDAAGNRIEIEAGQISWPSLDRGATPSPLPPNRTVAGRPICWDGHRFISEKWFGLPIAVTAMGPSFGESQAAQVIAGMRVSTDLQDPASWPTDIISRS